MGKWLCAHGIHIPKAERTPAIDPAPWRLRCRTCGAVRRAGGSWARG